MVEHLRRSETTLETSGEDAKNTLETGGEDAKIHSKRVEKMQKYTRNGWKRCKNTLETGGKDKSFRSFRLFANLRKWLVSLDFSQFAHTFKAFHHGSGLSFPEGNLLGSVFGTFTSGLGTLDESSSGGLLRGLKFYTRFECNFTSFPLVLSVVFMSAVFDTTVVGASSDGMIICWDLRSKENFEKDY